MSLFVNKQVNPAVHLLPSRDIESNQKVHRLNFLEDIIYKQELANQNIAATLESIDSLLKQSDSQFQQQKIRLDANIEAQKTIQQQLNDQVQIIEGMVNEKIRQMQDEEQDKVDEIYQAVMTHFNTHDKISLDLINKISEFENAIMDQVLTQQEIYKKIDILDVYQETVMERLDQQDAITHKITRQLENLKGIIFERFEFLSEKMENYSKVIIKNLTGLMFINQLKEEETLTDEQKVLKK